MPLPREPRAYRNPVLSTRARYSSSESCDTSFKSRRHQRGGCSLRAPHNGQRGNACERRITKAPSVHRGSVGCKQRRMYSKVGGRRGRGYVEGLVFRRVAHETVKVCDRFWDHRRLRARGHSRGCRQPTRRRKFAGIRFFLQAGAVKRRGTRRRRPPPRGRPDPARLARRRTRGQQAHLPARFAGGAAARPFFYAGRRRGRGRAAVPGGGGRPRGWPSRFGGGAPAFRAKTRATAFSAPSADPRDGRVRPAVASCGVEASTARPTRAGHGSSELVTKSNVDVCAGIRLP